MPTRRMDEATNCSIARRSLLLGCTALVPLSSLGSNTPEPGGERSALRDDSDTPKYWETEHIRAFYARSRF